MEKTLGEKLKALRGNKSIEQVTADLGISYSLWYRFENNSRVPRERFRPIIAKYFDVEVKDIFHD